METSLIGKALDFGSKECGFESLVSNLMLPYNVNAFLVNHINFTLISKQRWCFLRCSKKMIKILRLLKKIGLINSFLIFKSTSNFQFVKISPFLYKKSTFFKGIKLISTPSKQFNIKLKTLKILNQSLGETILILETSKGYITHYEALKKQLSGKLLFIIN